MAKDSRATFSSVNNRVDKSKGGHRNPAIIAQMESVISDLSLQIQEKDQEIMKWKEIATGAKRIKGFEDDFVTSESSTRLPFREDESLRLKSSFSLELEIEKLRTQLAETMEMMAIYRHKYHTTVEELESLKKERREMEVLPLKDTQYPSPKRFIFQPGVRKSITPLVHEEKRVNHRITKSTNTSSIAYLVPEPDAPASITPGTTRSSPCTVLHKAKSPYLRKQSSQNRKQSECKQYIPSFTRMQKQTRGSPPREAQTAPIRLIPAHEKDKSRPESRFADEFPEENELE